MACTVIAVFFFRFWTRTGDLLFAYFGAAFVLLGIERIVLVFFDIMDEQRPFTYLMRFSAFALIIYAIVQKNRENPTT